LTIPAKDTKKGRSETLKEKRDGSALKNDDEAGSEFDENQDSNKKGIFEILFKGF